MPAVTASPQTAGDGTLPRPRLLAALADQPVVWLIAPAGYGKSTLAGHVVASAGQASAYVELATATASPATVIAALRRGFARAGIAALASLAEAGAAGADDDGGATFADHLAEQLDARTDPLVVVIDEVQLAGGAAAELLGRLARNMRLPHRLLLMGRPGRLRPAHSARVIEAGDLAFSADEIAELAALAGRPLDAAAATQLQAATAGWPAAVMLALQAGHAIGGGSRQDVDLLARQILQRATPATRAAALVLASLPMFSVELAEALCGPGALDAVQDAGLPVTARLDRWLAVPDVVRDAIGSQGALTDEQAAAAARHYLAAGEAEAAIALLLGRAAPATLAAALAERPWTDLQAFGAAQLRTLLSL
ncbi:MAG TPA: AAA family ATPase, partial [Candidatus Limnocylindrales bacterium]